MKNYSILLLVVSVLMFCSCTVEDIPLEKNNEKSILQTDKQSDVDPTTVKPPTHG